MGKLYNFSRIQILPFKKRIGDLAVSNFWMNSDGVPESNQSHLPVPAFSYFEICKYEPNPYYGKLQEYISNGWELSFGGDFLEKERTSISMSFFEDMPETKYMLASWENLDHDECTPDLRLVGNRVFELTPAEQMTFLQLASIGQTHLETLLTKFSNENT